MPGQGSNSWNIDICPLSGLVSELRSFHVHSEVSALFNGNVADGVCVTAVVPTDKGIDEVGQKTRKGKVQDRRPATTTLMMSETLLIS